MDITFSCEGCGQHLTIDEIGAGMTIDCPKCGKPVYVQTHQPSETKSTAIRIEAGSARPYYTPETAPQSVAYPTPSPYVNRKDDSVHPAIQGSLICVLIYIASGLVSLILLSQDPFLAIPCMYFTVPVAAAAWLCACYGICAGQIKHGVALVVGISLIGALGYLAGMRTTMSDVSRQMEQLQKQMEQQMKQHFR